LSLGNLSSFPILPFFETEKNNHINFRPF
jgi:hypothetical protein